MKARSLTADHAHHGTPASAERARILSSISVTFRTKVTWWPRWASHRWMMSKLSPDRM